MQLGPQQAGRGRIQSHGGRICQRLGGGEAAPSPLRQEEGVMAAGGA